MELSQQSPVSEGHALISSVTSCRADPHTSSDPSRSFYSSKLGSWLFKINILPLGAGERSKCESKHSREAHENLLTLKKKLKKKILIM